MFSLQFEAERKVTWEFGPEGSVCEDAWFALVAMEAGYTIDFVEGDMLERSPFTLSDFMKQVWFSIVAKRLIK
jgi:egghead protein (zeste-white 4 protein)